MPHKPWTHPGGEWVPSEDVDPLANVFDRCARFESGRETPYWQYAAAKDGRITHWYFAPTEPNGQG